MKSHEELVGQAGYMRGAFINDTIFLERVIDEFICRHFCEKEERKIELIESLMATKRISFDSKMAIARFIIDSHYTWFKDKYPSCFKDVTSIIEHRNIFAHYLLDTSDQGFENLRSNVIGFIKFDRKTEVILYTSEQIMELDKKLRESVDAFQTLMT